MGTETSIDSVLRFILEKTNSRVALLGMKDQTTIGPDTKLLLSGLFDSIAFLALLGDLEEHFKIELDLTEHDPAIFASVIGLARIVAEAEVRNADTVATDSNAKESDFDFVLLTPNHPAWDELPRLFEAMYESFDQQKLSLKLRPGGALIWLDGISRSAAGMQCILGCLRNRHLVGFLHCSVRVVPPYLTEKLVGTIEAVYVDPRHRGNHLAEALANRATQWLQKKGIKQIELQVVTSNSGALEFWRKQGFQIELSQMNKRISDR